MKISAGEQQALENTGLAALYHDLLNMHRCLDLHAATLAWLEGLLRHNRLPLSGDVRQWIRAWGQAVGQVGMLNVNLANSANPELEKEINSHFSYGRQLGRMLEVMTPMVKAHQANSTDKEFQEAAKAFLEMAQQIHGLKLVSVDYIISKVRAWKGQPSFENNMAELLERLKRLS